MPPETSTRVRPSWDPLAVAERLPRAGDVDKVDVAGDQHFLLALADAVVDDQFGHLVVGFEALAVGPDREEAHLAHVGSEQFAGGLAHRHLLGEALFALP